MLDLARQRSPPGGRLIQPSSLRLPPPSGGTRSRKRANAASDAPVRRNARGALDKASRQKHCVFTDVGKCTWSHEYKSMKPLAKHYALEHPEYLRQRGITGRDENERIAVLTRQLEQESAQGAAPAAASPAPV